MSTTKKFRVDSVDPLVMSAVDGVVGKLTLPAQGDKFKKGDEVFVTLNKVPKSGKIAPESGLREVPPAPVPFQPII